MKGRIKLAVVAAVSVACGGHGQAQQQKIGAPPESQNMKLVGYSDLQARSAYQPTIHHQGDRYIAYIGHHGGTDEVPSPLPIPGAAGPRAAAGRRIAPPESHRRRSCFK